MTRLNATVSSMGVDAHVEAFEEGEFVFYVQDCVSAVDHIKGTFRERPPGGISHLKLDLKCMPLLIKINKYI